MDNKAMLVLVCEDHKMYFDLDGRNVLQGLPFPVVVFVNRGAAWAFEGLGPNVEVRIARWGNYDSVRTDARALAEQRGIFAVATVNEALMDFAAELRAALGTRGMHPPLAARFRDKLLMKALLQGSGLRLPEHARCSERDAVEALQHRHGKLALKPVDGLGSRDVSFVETPEALAAWYTKQTNPAGFEAEEFIDGPLHHVNAVVRDGKVLLTASALYVPGMANIDFRAGTPFVCVMTEDPLLRRRLEAYSTRVIETLGLPNGVTHLECFVTASGEIVFCEIAARPGGGGIVQMIESQCGINYSRATMLLEGGRGDLLAIEPPREDRLYGLMGFRLPRNSRIQRMPQRDEFAEDWISHVGLYAQAGDFVAAAKHCTDFVGLLVFASRDGHDFHDRRTQLHQRFYAGLALQ